MAMLPFALSPSPSPSSSSSSTLDTVSTGPLILLVVAFAAIIGVALLLTFVNVGASRRLLKAVKDSPELQAIFVDKNAPHSAIFDRASKPTKHVTRTLLAIIGFALLGLLTLIVFGLGGDGMQDLRSALAGAVVTLVATIGGFYFGTRAGESSPAASPVPAGTDTNGQ